MQVEALILDGVFCITPPIFHDERGSFSVPYQNHAFAQHGLSTDWVQDNQSTSVGGVLRGFHFQRPPYTETKLVRVLHGAILDVVVDLRRASATYGHHLTIELSADNRKMLYVPRGFAHAFCVLSDSATVHYKVDNDYTPSAAGGLRWDDPTLAVDWPIATPILSQQDQNLPFFAGFESPF
jgi:dTDP-4-dehydrorhamnose 3,5-epimerase